MSSKFDFGKKKVVECEVVDVSAPLDADVDVTENGEGDVIPVEVANVQSPISPSPSSSNVVARVGIGESLGKLFGGGKATNDSNIQRMAVIDENLPLITKTVDPLVQTIVDVLAIEADRDGLPDVAETYKNISHILDVRMGSHGGWRADQLQRIYTQRVQDEVGNPELQEKVEGLGKRGR